MPTTRPRAWIVAALGVLAVVLTACSGGGSSPPTPPPGAAPVVTGTFTGLADDHRTAVAVVADPVPAGQTSRSIRAYLCDGPGDLREWYPGQTSGNTATITSATGPSTVSVDLTAAASTGTATLADGRRLSFTAPAATGPAGLFDLTLQGTSVTGGSPTGQQFRATLGGPDGRTVVTGDVDGVPLRPVGLVAPTADYVAQASEPLRAIVLPDASVIGSSRGKGSGSPGYNYWTDEP